MGQADPELLLSLSDLWGPIGIMLILLGLPIVVSVALRPRLFWPFLIVSAIIGVGPRLAGYPILDEVLILGTLAGAMLHLVLRPQRAGPIDAGALDRFLFSIWTVYMIAQSVIGIYATDDPRVIRWVILYVMVGLVFAIAVYRRRYFPFPTARTACLLILWATAATYLAYLGQGYYYQQSLGRFGRFLSQDYIWAGSAYAVFPTLLAIPAALLLANDPSLRTRCLVWLNVALMVAVAFYFESRMSWFMFAAFVPVAWRVVRVRQVIAAFALCTVMYASYIPDPLQNAGAFVGELVGTSQALWNPSDSDVGRTLQVRAALMTATRDPKTFLVGAGVYEHRYAIVPAITALIDEFLPAQTFVVPGARDDSGLGLTLFRTTGFAALLIDTGIIGLLMFTTLAGLCAVHILRLPTASRFILVVPLGVALLWLLSNNILDIMLLYLLIMPSGVLQELAERMADQEEQTAEDETMAILPVTVQ